MGPQQKKNFRKPGPRPSPMPADESPKSVASAPESASEPQLESKWKPNSESKPQSSADEPESRIPRQRQSKDRQSTPEDASSDRRLSKQPNSRQNSRQSSSKVNPRKVSEGSKQLPPNAYRFVRESYLSLDSDSSGSVSRETLKDMSASLGLQDPGEKRLNSMLKRSGEPVTFAGYLAVVGELLADLPSQEEMDVMMEAFQTKDGKFDEKELRAALSGEGLQPDEIESVMARFSRPTRFGPAFDAKTFASTMSI